MSLHVMYYRPFDRLMGSRIINDFEELMEVCRSRSTAIL